MVIMQFRGRLVRQYRACPDLVSLDFYAIPISHSNLYIYLSPLIFK